MAPACELEGPPSAFASFLFDRSLSGVVFSERKGELQPDHWKTGHRLKQQNIDSETGEVVSREERRAGMRLQKAQYLIVEDQEIHAVQIESNADN
jgi:hypothetical protein